MPFDAAELALIRESFQERVETANSQYVRVQLRATRVRHLSVHLVSWCVRTAVRRKRLTCCRKELYADLSYNGAGCRVAKHVVARGFDEQTRASASNTRRQDALRLATLRCYN